MTQLESQSGIDSSTFLVIRYPTPPNSRPTTKILRATPRIIIYKERSSLCIYSDLRPIRVKHIARSCITDESFKDKLSWIDYDDLERVFFLCLKGERNGSRKVSVVFNDEYRNLHVILFKERIFLCIYSGLEPIHLKRIE